MKNTSAFIEKLRGEKSIDVNHESASRRVCEKLTLNGITLEFYVDYSVRFFDFIGASHFSPEEFDIEYTNESHDEIALYLGAEYLEITDQELHEIDCILDKLLY